MVRALFSIVVSTLTFVAAQAQADIDVTCMDSDCIHNGWTVTNPTGEVVTVACRDADCNVHGWSSSLKDLRAEDTICKPGGCFSEGWRAYGTQNGLLSNEVTCLSSPTTTDCLTNGWSTFVPNRGSYLTRCSQGDCRNNGWDINGRPTARCKAGGCFVTGWTVYQ
jgi:hypothetical protein